MYICLENKRAESSGIINTTINYMVYCKMASILGSYSYEKAESLFPNCRSGLAKRLALANREQLRCQWAVCRPKLQAASHFLSCCSWSPETAMCSLAQSAG